MDMALDKGVFSAKLADLEAAYARLNICLGRMEGAAGAELRAQCQALEAEERRWRASLQEEAGSRHPFAAALARLQLQYQRGMGELLSQPLGAGPGQGAEEAALAAEHMMDHAAAACRQALWAAAEALLLQAEAGSPPAPQAGDGAANPSGR